MVDASSDRAHGIAVRQRAGHDAVPRARSLPSRRSRPYSPHRTECGGGMADAGVELRLGTRGSPLALAQAHETRRRLAAAHGWGDDAVAIVVIRTTGDAIQDRALAEAGGKGLFTKELDTGPDRWHDRPRGPFGQGPAHRFCPTKSTIAGYLPREDVRDAFVSLDGPPGSRTCGPARWSGSASLRRQRAGEAALRPDLEVRLLRGNVETRLGQDRRAVSSTPRSWRWRASTGSAWRIGSPSGILDEAIEFLPAVGARRHRDRHPQDGDCRDPAAYSRPILDRPTPASAVTCERAFLTVLDGSCRTPIAGYARVVNGRRPRVPRPRCSRADGSEAVEAETKGRAGRRRVPRGSGSDAGARPPRPGHPPHLLGAVHAHPG